MTVICGNSVQFFARIGYTKSCVGGWYMIYLLCFSQLPWIIPNTNACTFLSKVDKLFFIEVFSEMFCLNTAQFNF